jgi:hypothetical protein
MLGLTFCLLRHLKSVIHQAAHCVREPSEMATLALTLQMPADFVGFIRNNGLNPDEMQHEKADFQWQYIPEW